MKKKVIQNVISTVLVAMMIVGCGAKATPEGDSSTSDTTKSASSDGNAATRTLQVGHVNPSKEDDQFQRYAVLFKENLEEISDGAFAIEIMGDAQLGGDRDMLEGLQMGTLDMGLISNFTIGLFSPVFQVFNLPYIFETGEEAYAIFDDPEAMEPLREELYNSCNIQLLSFAEGGFRYMLNNVRPINTVADMKDIKFRLPESPIYVDTFKALGSNPTTMPYTETFAAVQQGTVDGLEIPLGSIHSSGYYEINDYLSMTEHFYSPIGVMLSRTVWDSLTDQEKQWFNEAAEKTTKEHRIFFAEVELKYLEDIAASGIEINEVADKSEFREAVKPVIEAYREEFGGDILDRIK